MTINRPVPRLWDTLLTVSVIAASIAAALVFTSWPAQPSGLVMLSTATEQYRVRLTVDRPRTGSQSWLIEISDPQDHPVPAARVLVEPAMPQMGHAIAALTAVAEAPGRFRVADVVLPMPGHWEITVTITASGASDRVVFPLLVLG